MPRAGSGGARLNGAVTSFDYSNLSGRPPGLFLRSAARVSRGVRDVQAQVAPYAAWWEQQNRAALTDDGPLWVVLGDSMSQGIGASAPDRGWVGALRARLPHRVVNLSVSGGLIRDVIDRQLPALRSLPVVPDLVTVMIGSNDLFNRRQRHLVEAHAAELVAELPDGAVVASLPQPRRAARAFNEAVTATGRFRLAEFRDPRLRSWSGRLAADRFHPNDAGYAAMAQIMAEAVDRTSG